MSSSLRPCLENSFYFQCHFTCPRQGLYCDGSMFNSPVWPVWPVSPVWGLELISFRIYKQNRVVNVIQRDNGNSNFLQLSLKRLFNSNVCLDIGAAYAELATTRRFTFPSLAAVVSCSRTLVLSSKCSVSSNKSLSECGSVGVGFCNMPGQYKCVDLL